MASINFHQYVFIHFILLFFSEFGWKTHPEYLRERSGMWYNSLYLGINFRLSELRNNYWQKNTPKIKIQDYGTHFNLQASVQNFQGMLVFFHWPRKPPMEKGPGLLSVQNCVKGEKLRMNLNRIERKWTTRVCSNLQHFHLDTKTSSWKPHLTLLSKANRPIRSAPAGDYEDVSPDTAAAGSPLAWQALDPRGWNGKIWFLQEGPSVLRGVMRKRCLSCTGREEIWHIWDSSPAQTQDSDSTRYARPESDPY